MEEGVGADMRQVPGALLDPAPSRSYESVKGFDTRRGWWVWSVLLAGLANQAEKPDRPEGPLRGFGGGLF